MPLRIQFSSVLLYILSSNVRRFLFQGSVSISVLYFLSCNPVFISKTYRMRSYNVSRDLLYEFKIVGSKLFLAAHEKMESYIISSSYSRSTKS